MPYLCSTTSPFIKVPKDGIEISFGTGLGSNQEGCHMRIGYARVSTHEQNLDLQKDALLKAGCGKVFKDKASGSAGERPGLKRAMDVLREGDTLVVWKLDRLGRSLSHLVELISELRNNGVGFRSLQENVDTTSGVGKLVFHIFASLAEFERDLVRERTLAGLAAARARGRMGGRPKVLDEKKIAQAQAMHSAKMIPIKEICSTLGIGKTTLYRYLSPKDKQNNQGRTH
jgi:DNA invertase Pin-like site-specific DNA recombinase